MCKGLENASQQIFLVLFYSQFSSRSLTWVRGDMRERERSKERKKERNLSWCSFLPLYICTQQYTCRSTAHTVQVSYNECVVYTVFWPIFRLLFCFRCTNFQITSNIPIKYIFSHLCWISSSREQKYMYAWSSLSFLLWVKLRTELYTHFIFHCCSRKKVKWKIWSPLSFSSFFLSFSVACSVCAVCIVWI